MAALLKHHLVLRAFVSCPFWKALDGVFLSRFAPWFLGVADDGGRLPKDAGDGAVFSCTERKSHSWDSDPGVARGTTPSAS